MNTPSINEALALFKADLWKDQRRLELVEYEGAQCIRKEILPASDSTLEASVLETLQDVCLLARPATLVAVTEQAVFLRYVAGIRLFNLFVELDRLPHQGEFSAPQAKVDLLAKTDSRQAEIQRGLIAWSQGRRLRAYPAALKLSTILRVLAGALEMQINWRKLDLELELVDELWSSQATVPFRDATTKNMILADPLLALQTSGEKARTQRIEQSLAGGRPNWLDADVFDVDFSSCVELTTPEDDFISLHFHERTWIGGPERFRWLNWTFEEDRQRAALTFLVRYLRFGGRKAAYRLLHPKGHRVRFRHDRDSFYFERLPAILHVLWPTVDRAIPYLLSIIEALARVLPKSQPSSDLFEEAGLGESRSYYVDVFPV